MPASLNRQEQYSKRNCLLSHGSPENKNENNDQIVIETLKEKLGEKINEVGLDWTQRLGASKDDKVRAIIVKFLRSNTRSRIFRDKKKLKGKKVSITESLTKTRMEALKRIQEEFEFYNAWTYDEKIIYKDVNDNKIKTYYH